MDSRYKRRGLVARCRGNPSAPPVVWLRIGNCTNRALFAWLEPQLQEVISRLVRGEKIIEIRKPDDYDFR